MADPIDEAKAKLCSLSPQEWREVASKLCKNPGYKPSQTRENMHLVLDSLGISLPKTDDIATKLLDEGSFKGVSADILFALSTNQLNWFDELTLASKVKGRERIS